MNRDVSHWIVVLVVLVIWITYTFQDWELLGFQQAEIFGHVWSHDWRFDNFPNYLRGTDQTVHTDNFPLIDVIPTTLIFILKQVVSVPTAEVVFCLLMIGINAVVLRSFVDEIDFPNSIVLLGVSTPILWGSYNSGLTEDWGLCFTMLSVIALRQDKLFISAIALACTAYFGLVLGWMSGIFLLLYTLVFRVSVRKLGIVLGMTTVGVLPLCWFHWDRLMLVGHRSLSPPDLFHPLWMLNPWHHTDLASLFVVGTVDFQEEILRLHPSSLGWIAMIVSMFCKEFRWWLLFLCFVGFSLGPEVYWMGYSLGIPNPFHWFLSWVPGASLINHHGRWMLMSVLCWIVIVIKGVKRAPCAQWIIGLIVIEWLFLTPVGFPLMGTEKISNSAVLQKVSTVSMPENTRLLRIPVRGPGVVFQQALYEQTVHRQSLWMNPNRPNPSDWFSLTESSQWIETIAFEERLPQGACLPKGVGILLVTKPYVTLIVNHFGRPDMTDQQYAYWSSFPICTE